MKNNGLLLVIFVYTFFNIQSKNSPTIANPNFIQFKFVKKTIHTVNSSSSKLMEMVESIPLEKEVLFNLNDIDHADLYIINNNDTDSVGVLVMFNKEGKKKLHQITKENIGRKIATIVNDKIISVPPVAVPISNGTAIIYNILPKEDAEQKVKMINKMLNK